MALLQQVADQLAISLLAEGKSHEIERPSRKIRFADEIQVEGDFTSRRAALVQVIEVEKMATDMSSVRGCRQRELSAASRVAENPFAGG